MNVLNGSEQYKMRAEDFGMESAQPDKIVLPYFGVLWGDFLLDIMNAVCRRMAFPHDALYEQIVKQVSAGFSLMFSRRKFASLLMLMYSRLMERHFVIVFLFRPAMMRLLLYWTGFFNVVVVD